MAICEQHGLQVKWFDEEARAVCRRRRVDQVTIRSAGNGAGQPAFAQPGGRLKYELAFFIGHKVLHNGDGASRLTAPCIRGRRGIELRAGMGAQDVLYAWRDFECSFFAVLCCARAFRFADF